MKCQQTGRKIKSKVKDLSREEDMQPLAAKDLTKGSKLLTEIKGASYAVAFVKFSGTYIFPHYILTATV